ncbi:CypX Cytochrome P450 [Pyrenophora tritici-repentis]|nr:cytochrome P450 52A1 [Pyrenophora tritici-repentis]KAI0572567.1 cytochrome P450 52A1 [Pyrenophora tritici-repentis]KAI0618730.1 cytochrome P450 52A1 [Pyrenophora tritici-repentis]KAI1547765.1 hypothetical protein PtrSN001C_002354 [Pyrenophora tritici-repentis]KAI1555374.1 CypX Cytochrome P450 [Pyrenophora tritici-repentis]
MLASLNGLQASVAIFIFILIYYNLRKWQMSRKLKRLGARAPEIQSSWPFGIDFIYKYVVASANNQEISFFASCLASASYKDSSSTISSSGTKTSTSTIKGSCMTAQLNSGLSGRLVLTVDPSNIKTLVSEMSDYGKGERFHEVWKEFIGDSIFAIDGELWGKTRTKMKPIFFKENVVDTAIFEGHVAQLIDILDERGDRSESPDLLNVFLRYTFDVATDFLFSEATNCLKFPQLRVAEAFKYILQRQSDLDNMDEFSWLLSRTKFRQELKVLDDFVYPYIYKSLALTSDQLQSKLSSRDNLLDSLALHTRDAKFLRDQMITILVAGRDTTAVTLSFLFFELSRNPVVLETLKKEIVDKIGEGDAATTPSVKDLQEMKMLNAVIDETFRFYPPVPLNFRCALRDTTLPRGGGEDGMQPIGVLKGTKVLFSIMLVHKNPDLYPAIEGKRFHDPNKWIPARWLDADEGRKCWTPELWNFLPFHHGKRACPGQKFAQVEIAYTVARILQTYKTIKIMGWDQADSKGRDLECRVAVTMSPAEELNVRHKITYVFVEKRVKKDTKYYT